MDTTYIFLQHYWWFLVSLLGALLVFLLFVQGGNSLLFRLGSTEEERSLLVNSTGRKWEFTFTTLVTFGGAFFASFPLFYSTSFGGAYWLWMIILFSFVLQAVSYEFQSKLGNLLGKRTYQHFLVINGVVGPVLLGAAVATFFNGSGFVVSKSNLTDEMMPVISHWLPPSADNGCGSVSGILSGFCNTHTAERRLCSKSGHRPYLHGAVQIFQQSGGYALSSHTLPDRSGGCPFRDRQEYIQQDLHTRHLVCRNGNRACRSVFIAVCRI